MTLAIGAHLRSLQRSRRETKIILMNDFGFTAVLLPSSSQRWPSSGLLFGSSTATIRPQADLRRRSPKQQDKDNSRSFKRSLLA
jgi:hypothetical protein